MAGRMARGASAASDWSVQAVTACIPQIWDIPDALTPGTMEALTAEEPFEPQPLEEHIQGIEAALQKLDEKEPEVWVAEQAQRVCFQYKRRKCMGSALHVAVQHEGGAELVEQLLLLSADVHEECKYISFNKVATAQPIHLAVQSGQPHILELLLGSGADIDAKARRNERPHFCPLHEAAFFRQHQVTRFLLERSASVNAQNQEGMTPLHVASKMGAADVAEVLLHYGADIGLKDQMHRTALQVAVQSGVFPHRRLHLLANWRIADIMVVAEHCPSAVAEFMRDLSADGSLGTQAASRLQEEEALSVAHWIELMDEAPEAGGLLLEVLTVEPEEDSTFYHPLPGQACVSELHCEYNQDATWRCDTEMAEGRSKPWPRWHDQLAPGSETIIKRQKTSRQAASRQKSMRNRNSCLGPVVSFVRAMLNRMVRAAGVSAQNVAHSKSELNPVHIRQLRLPGMICPEVFHVLSETHHLDIFKNKATQAVLEFAWQRFVKQYHTMQLIHRIGEIAVLVLWTFNEPSWEEGSAWSDWKRRSCWSFVFVSSLRETIRELSEAYNYICYLDDPSSYFMNAWNYIDLCAIGLFNAFSWVSMTDLQLNHNPRIFSAVALFRWIQLLYTFRAYSMGRLGIRGIIPILHSIKEIGGMLIICIFVFAGFTHAFLALDQNHNPAGWQDTVVSSFRLLLLSDGDGIDDVLKLGGYDSSGGLSVTFLFLVLAVFVFCISLLNLFIAVHGEAYSQAHRDAKELQLQERASICLHCMLQPHWPPPKCLQLRVRCLGWKVARPASCCLALNVVFIGIWAGLLCIHSLHPAVPAVILLCAILLGNCFLAQRPWESEAAGARSFVWWCAPVHLHHPEASHGADLEALCQRLGYLEHGVESLLAEAERRSIAEKADPWGRNAPVGHCAGRMESKGGRPRTGSPPKPSKLAPEAHPDLIPGQVPEFKQD